jgi:hypothetical protein
LYNDANDFNTSTWQNGGTGSLASWDSLTNSSKDGFVASTDNTSGSTENAVCSLNFTNVVPDNGRVFVSFNCEFGGTAVTEAGKKLRVQLRDSSGNIANDIVQPADGGDGATQFRICNQGFNSVAFTVNSSTASNIEFLLEVANGRTGSATVTDLKVSRIARNGFVETWYDQSGNGNDATQGTASNQPKIVSNGGLSPDGLEFDGSDDVLVSTSFSATQPITSLAVFKSSNTSDSQTVVGGVSYNFIIHRAGGAATAGLNAGTLYAPFSSIATKQLMTTLASGTSSRVAQNGNLSSTGNAGTNDWTQLGIGSNGNGGTAGSGSAKFDGTIEEVIVFDADKISDITEIERDIANYYNITLS